MAKRFGFVIIPVGLCDVERGGIKKQVAMSMFSGLTSQISGMVAQKFGGADPNAAPVDPNAAPVDPNDPNAQ